jgi:hypothetical protein
MKSEEWLSQVEEVRAMLAGAGCSAIRVVHLMANTSREETMLAVYEGVD